MFRIASPVQSDNSTDKAVGRTNRRREKTRRRSRDRERALLLQLLTSQQLPPPEVEQRLQEIQKAPGESSTVSHSHSRAKTLGSGSVAPKREDLPKNGLQRSRSDMAPSPRMNTYQTLGAPDVPIMMTKSPEPLFSKIGKENNKAETNLRGTSRNTKISSGQNIRSLSLPFQEFLRAAPLVSGQLKQRFVSQVCVSQEGSDDTRQHHCHPLIIAFRETNEVTHLIENLNPNQIWTINLIDFDKTDLGDIKCLLDTSAIMVSHHHRLVHV